MPADGKIAVDPDFYLVDDKYEPSDFQSCALKAKFSIHVPGTDDHDLHRTRQEGTRDEVRLHCR
ncbi:unnamed protein product [Penicillium camemberti]|uniref:Str. FM013 n=1 Tax=Penicillium camemberti (strain FM 013) TaxID=1429867 RepID=A0A0G4PXM9_PENC3|nr:unnamed protein product [Penicillium camemberti]